MNDPIRQALETRDDCELGRLMRVHYSALLDSLAMPDNPYGGGGVESRHGVVWPTDRHGNVQTANLASPMFPRTDRVHSRSSDRPASTPFTYGANAQVDALTMGDLCRRAAPKARREVGPMGGSPDQRTCNVRTTPKPEIDTGRSTPFTPTRPQQLPSQDAGGVGFYQPNPPSDAEVRAAWQFKYGAL